MANTSCDHLKPHNYHTWKEHMTRLLMSKGLWSCLDEVQPLLTRPFEVLQHRKKMDEAMGLIFLHITYSLLFHLEGCLTPQSIQTKFHDLFGTINQSRALQIEVELTALTPNSFPSIEDFLMKFKSLQSLLQGCGKTKTNTECIYLILSRL